MVITMRERPGTAGFSLVELMVVIVIVGIVAATAAPAMRDYLANQRMKTAAFNLIVTTMFARGEAVKRGIPVYIKAPSSNNLSNGWCVLVTAGAACSTSAPGVETMRVQQPLSGVTYTFKTTAGTISFNRAGRLASRVKIDIVDNELPTLTRCITIDIGGTASSESGACP